MDGTAETAAVAVALGNVDSKDWSLGERRWDVDPDGGILRSADG